MRQAALGGNSVDLAHHDQVRANGLQEEPNRVIGVVMPSVSHVASRAAENRLFTIRGVGVV